MSLSDTVLRLLAADKPAPDRTERALIAALPNAQPRAVAQTLRHLARRGAITKDTEPADRARPDLGCAWIAKGPVSG